MISWPEIKRKNLFQNKKLKREIFSILFTLVLVVSLTLVIAVPAMAGTTYTVDDDWQIGVAPYAEDTDGETDFATIQAAIDVAAAGDTIIVAAGIYNENVNVNKSLTLQGADSAIVTVTAAINTTSVFTVRASNVNISGFTISGATGPSQAGISLNSYSETSFNTVAFCNISNNILTGNNDGIFLYNYGLSGGVNHNTFTKNTASNNSRVGFDSFYSDYNTFDANIASSNGLAGFNLQASSHNTFTGNEANANPGIGGLFGYGFCLGGEEDGSDYNTLTGNTANLNNYGIYIIGGDNNTLTGNTFNLNVVEGFRLRKAFVLLLSITNLTVQNNTITNSPIGIDIYSTITDVTSWIVTHNNISGNTVYGVSNNSASTLNATNNWWGANNGPDDDAGVINGSGGKISTNVDANPWLVIGVSANPVSIKADGTSTSTITADMTKNSDGVDTSGSGHIPDGTQITLSTNKGSIGSLTVNKTTTNGKATATLTSSITGETATVTASASPHTPAATAITAVNFVEMPLVTHTITANAGVHGRIDPSGAVLVNHGDNKAFTITPSTGYHVVDVLMDGVSQGAVNSYTFTNVIANHTITASFGITGGGGGGESSALVPSIETKVILQGLAYPNAKITILIDGKVATLISADSQANFKSEITNITAGVYTFGLWANDKAGRKSITFSFTVMVAKDITTTVSNIFLPPTIELEKVNLSKGEDLNILGQTVPKSEITVSIGSPQEIIKKTTAANTGDWNDSLDTSVLDEGTHTARVKAETPEGLLSSYSNVLAFYVGKYGIAQVCPGADFNKDKKVNLTDFSILLYWWGKNNPCVDLNGDGIVNLPDFSILMYYWTG